MTGEGTDRIERGEHQALFVGRQIDVQDGDGRFLAGEGERDPGVAVDHVAAAAVDQHLLNPADRVERTGQCRFLVLRVDAPVGWVRRQRLGRLGA